MCVILLSKHAVQKDLIHRVGAAAARTAFVFQILKISLRCPCCLGYTFVWRRIFRPRWKRGGLHESPCHRQMLSLLSTMDSRVTSTLTQRSCYLVLFSGFCSVFDFAFWFLDPVYCGWKVSFWRLKKTRLWLGVASSGKDKVGFLSMVHSSTKAQHIANFTARWCALYLVAVRWEFSVCGTAGLKPRNLGQHPSPFCAAVEHSPPRSAPCGWCWNSPVLMLSFPPPWDAI